MKSSNSLSRILPFAVTGLLLVVCLLLPLLFTGGEGQALPSNPGEGMTASERARLYSRYSDGELSLQDLDASEVGSTELVNCTRIYNTIVDTLVMDEGDVRVEDAQGYNFYRLSDGVHELRFVEFYHQWTGDWSNWIRLRIDLDTLDVYQLYYSASVLRNAQHPGDNLPRKRLAGSNRLLLGNWRRFFQRLLLSRYISRRLLGWRGATCRV